MFIILNGIREATVKTPNVPLLVLDAFKADITNRYSTPVTEPNSYNPVIHLNCHWTHELKIIPETLFPALNLT